MTIEPLLSMDCVTSTQSISAGLDPSYRSRELPVMTVLTLPANSLRFLKLVDSNPNADFKIARHRIGMFEGHRQQSIKVGAFARSLTGPKIHFLDLQYPGYPL